MDYITNNEIIIFDPSFNKKLDPTLLKNYKQLIFSNYNLGDYNLGNYNLFEAYENNNF